MIKQIRKSSEKFFNKLLLFVIGVGCTFLGFSSDFFASDNTALSIDNKTVSIQELDKEIRRQVAQMQQIMGTQAFNYKEALKVGLVEQIIDNMTSRILLDLEAENNGITVSNEKIYDIIKNTPDFQDEKGKFSPEKLAYMLEQNNETENNLIKEVSNSISRQILLNSVIGSISNESMAEIAYKNKNQKVKMDVVSFKVDKEKISKEPTNDELKEIYEQNKDIFKQPEYRKISYILISPENAKSFKNIKDDDDKIYKTMIEIGENIIDEINGGANVNEIAKTFNVTKVNVPDLDVEGKKRDGSLFKDKTFTQKFRDIAFFALDENGTSDVLDNGENVMIIIVEKVYPASPKSFENVKKEVKNIWLEKEKIAQASKKVNDIFTALKNEEKFNVAVKKVDSSANAILNTETGKQNSVYSEDFLTKVFNTELNKPLISKSGNNYAVAVVREVIIPEITDKKDFEEFKKKEKENFAQMLVDDYITYLHKKYRIKRNDKLIQRLFN